MKIHVKIILGIVVTNFIILIYNLYHDIFKLVNTGSSFLETFVSVQPMMGK